MTTLPPFSKNFTPLTTEQRRIVDCDLLPGQSLKVVAFAGTGKTTTLAAYASARPDLRFLYIAFNKSVQMAAAGKFPPNVTARTSHSLAFRAKGYLHKDRLTPGFRAGSVMDALQLEQFEDAKFTIDTLYRYLISDAPRVIGQHIPHEAKIFYDQRKAAMPDFVKLANRLGRLMCDGTDPRIGMLHDGYLKLYQLSSPILPFDCILLDEAQDINPVTAAIVTMQARPGFKPQPSAIIVVGDSHQQIYGFRGAKDTLKHFRATKTLYLTRSFRFDDKVASLANLVLATFKGEKTRLKGTPKQDSKPAAGKTCPSWDDAPYTIIARTNAVIFDKAAQLCGSRKIGFVGGIQGYRMGAIKDVYHLFARKRQYITDPFINRFPNYQAMKTYAEAAADIELSAVCKVVETHTIEIPRLVQTITEKSVDEAEAEVLLTTAHKAKGLEWANVHLMGDFHPLMENDGPIPADAVDPDEFNLIYVALTRARSRLRFDQSSTIPEFVKACLGKAPSDQTKRAALRRP